MTACRRASSFSTTTRSFVAVFESSWRPNPISKLSAKPGLRRRVSARIPPTHPDVAVLDVRLPDGDGVEVCREIRSRHPEIRCLMLTSFADDEALFGAIMAGASGYLLKQVRGTDLVDAIRKVGRGESLLDPAMTARVLERLRAPEKNELAALTDQERRVLGSRRRGPDEPADRRANVPRREDGQELRVEPAVEARYEPAQRSGCVRGTPRRAPAPPRPVAPQRHCGPGSVARRRARRQGRKSRSGRRFGPTRVTRRACSMPRCLSSPAKTARPLAPGRPRWP